MKILISDDYEAFASLLSEELTNNYGFKSESVYTVFDTIKKLKRNKYDVLVLDYNFGRMKRNGELVMKYINKHNIKILVIPNSAEQEYNDKLILLGAIKESPEKSLNKLIEILDNLDA